MADVINLTTYREQSRGQTRELQVDAVHHAAPCGLCGGAGGQVSAQALPTTGTGLAQLVVTGMPCMACGRVGRRGSAA